MPEPETARHKKPPHIILDHLKHAHAGQAHGNAQKNHEARSALPQRGPKFSIPRSSLLVLGHQVCRIGALN